MERHSGTPGRSIIYILARGIMFKDDGPFLPIIDMYFQHDAIVPTICQVVTIRLGTLKRIPQTKWTHSYMLMSIGPPKAQIGVDTPQFAISL